MKSHLFILLFCFTFCSLTVTAQQPIKRPIVRCGTELYYQQLFRNNASLKQQFELNQKMLARRRVTTQAQRIESLNDTIPIAIHVVADSTIQKLVTDAIIQSQIDVLNEDYEGRNADSTRIPAAFKPLYAKSRLVFQLARTNPYGEPTNGISRKITDDTYNTNTSDNAKFSYSGGEDAWDPSQYLNIWVVSFGESGLLGVSVFPGDPRSITYHGFVCDYRAFGRGAPYLDPYYNKGRTTTHELGHFFNLWHVWGDDGGSCTGTDFPDDSLHDDTPNQTDAVYGNPDPTGTGVVVTDACSPTAPGIMYQNYMEYCDDEAMVMFTKGQQYRMNAALTLSPDRLPLLQSTTYHAAPVYKTDAHIPIVFRPSSGSWQCSTITPKVMLRNSGTGTLTSVQIVTILNNNTPIVYNWSGRLASYTDTTITLPAITAPTGNNILKIYTQDPNNTTDENSANDTTTVSYIVPTILPLNGLVQEGFNSPAFPPAGWHINNPDGDTTWQYNAAAGYSRPGSAWFNDYNNPAIGRYDDLVMPTYSYQNIDSVFLTFHLAAATYSDPNTTSIPIDTLSVLVSKDCGNSFVTVYKKWGRELQTVSNPDIPVTDAFYPGISQWRRDSINLGNYLATSEAQLQIAFRFSGNYENNIFLDDINLKTIVLPVALKQKGYLILPSPFHTQFGIWHYQQPSDLKAISIYTMTGQLIWQQKFNGNANKFITVNLQRQPAGVYIVRMDYTGTDQPVSERILKY